MISQNQEKGLSKSKSTDSTSTLVLCCLMGLFVFLSSFSPAFYKTIDNSTVIQHVMQGSTSPSLGSDLSQLVQVINGLKITQVVFPILVAILFLLVLFVNRKNIFSGIKLTGLALLIPGIVAFVIESILYVVFNSLQGIQNYTIFLWFSGTKADIVKMVTLQMGNIFLFYWGLTSFGTLTLGLILILVARVFRR